MRLKKENIEGVLVKSVTCTFSSIKYTLSADVNSFFKGTILMQMLCAHGFCKLFRNMHNFYTFKNRFSNLTTVQFYHNFLLPFYLMTCKQSDGNS